MLIAFDNYDSVQVLTTIFNDLQVMNVNVKLNEIYIGETID